MIKPVPPSGGGSQPQASTSSSYVQVTRSTNLFGSEVKTITYKPGEQSNIVELMQEKTCKNIFGTTTKTTYQFKEHETGEDEVKIGEKTFKGTWEAISPGAKTTSVLGKVFGVFGRVIDLITGRSHSVSAKYTLSEMDLRENLIGLLNRPDLSKSGKAAVKAMLYLMEGASTEGSKKRIDQQGVFSRPADRAKLDAYGKSFQSQEDVPDFTDVDQACHCLKELLGAIGKGELERYFKISLTELEPFKSGASKDDKIQVIVDAIKARIGNDSIKTKVFKNFILFLKMTTDHHSNNQTDVTSLAQDCLGPMLEDPFIKATEMDVNRQAAKFLLENADAILAKL